MKLTYPYMILIFFLKASITLTSSDDKSESTAFDKSETNSWREDSKVLKAIGPYLKSTKLSSTQFEEVTAKLRPAFHLAFGDDVNVKLPTTPN